MTADGPEPGWYFDPDGGDHERFWNGQAWTEHRRAKPSAFKPAAPPEFETPGGAPTPSPSEAVAPEQESASDGLRTLTTVPEPAIAAPAPQRQRPAKTRQLIQRDQLGTLSKIGQGGQGVVSRAPKVKTKFADSLVYKEYKAAARTGIDFTALAAMPALVEESLSYTQAERLISIAAWPCAIVEDGSTPTGFVMPAIPDAFFIALTTVKGVSTTTAEFQHLLNHPQVLAARGIALDDVQRITLLRETASALVFLHKHGVSVGDISPKNLLFSLTPHEAVYFIDCDAMRVNTVSALPQVETPGWNAPAGEELATIYTDAYKLGLLALRLLSGDQHTTNPQHLPATTPPLLRQIITDTLTSQPHQRPLPEAWTYILGNAIEHARHQEVTAAPVGTVSAPPPAPVVRSRPPGHSAPPVRTSGTSSSTPQPPKWNAAGAPSSVPGHAFSPKKGSWAKVVAAGDDYHGQIGKIIEIRDDKDGFDLVLEFRGVPDSYAFRRDEVIAAAAPAEGQPAPGAPPSGGDFWLNVGIDPIRIITSGHDCWTLRCYLDGAPIFLGSTGRINVFRSGQALRHYLAGNPSNDMSSLCTYRDITIAANDGTLPVDDVTDDNVYVLKGLARDIAAGPRRVDRRKLELAVELLSDFGEYIKNTIVEDYLQSGQPLGDLVHAVLAGNYVRNPSQSPRDASAHWTHLEDFLESRLREK